jgi:hypothetical protein
MAWVISLVWTSRTCRPGLTWASGRRVEGVQVGLGVAQVGGEGVVGLVGDQHRLTQRRFTTTQNPSSASVTPRSSPDAAAYSRPRPTLMSWMPAFRPPHLPHARPRGQGSHPTTFEIVARVLHQCERRGAVDDEQSWATEEFVALGN